MVALLPRNEFAALWLALGLPILSDQFDRCISSLTSRTQKYRLAQSTRLIIQ
jgi:hypothetical protein